MGTAVCTRRPPSRAPLFPRKTRRAALSTFIAENHPPVNNPAPFNRRDVTLMELPLKNEFCLAIAERPTAMEMTRSLLQEAALEPAAEAKPVLSDV